MSWPTCAAYDAETGADEFRVAASSLLDMESKLNRAIEDKTLLEQEVVFKGELEDQIQRLKTELRGELKVSLRIPSIS